MVMNFLIHENSYLRIMSRAVSTTDGFESEDADFIEPRIDLFREVRLRVDGIAWGTGGPGGCQVLADGEAAHITL